MIRIGAADKTLQDEITVLFRENLLGEADFTPEAADALPDGSNPLNGCCHAIVCGKILPADALVHLLRGHGKNGASLRKALSLHEALSLCGTDRLRILCPDSGGRVSADLPDGVWTELSDGEACLRTYRRICPPGKIPVLVPPNALLPILPDDLSPDPDRVTLHWFEPDGSSSCAGYSAVFSGNKYHTFPEYIHLVVHRNGTEDIII